MPSTENSPREKLFYHGMVTADAILLTKVFLSILWEYRGYFPADFESAFLSGKRAVFHGNYRVAFYAHILSGPIALLLATLLIITGGRVHLRRWHRRAGKVLLALSLLVMLPSSLVMAKNAYAGSVAALGFASLAITTGFSLILAAQFAANGKIKKHQKWAIRSFVLLISPLNTEDRLWLFDLVGLGKRVRVQFECVVELDDTAGRTGIDLVGQTQGSRTNHRLKQLIAEAARLAETCRITKVSQSCKLNRVVAVV